ncbi:MAG: FkbM family methyltransferase [Flavobacteriales bacterium]
MKSTFKSTINQFLANQSILIVDIGAKGALCRLIGLEELSEKHGFEPNLIEFNRLQKTEDGIVKLFPTAVAQTDGRRTFYMARSSSYSSFLRPDIEEFSKHFGRMKDFPKWKNKIETIGKTVVPCRSLDSIYGESGEIISLLKLDTQGTELEIIRGAERLLKEKRILAIKTEFLFQRVYKDQCVFTDLETLLKTFGFMLVSCEFYPDGLETRSIVGFDKPRIGAGGDAIFVLAEPLEKERLKTSLVLGSLGYLSEMDHMLQKISMINQLERESLLVHFSKLHNQYSLKQIVRQLVPPILFNLLKRVRLPESI